jgi:O-antigen/teichoic acid export membrane protein
MNRLADRYNSLPKQLKASFWYLVCNFVQKAVSVIFTPVFTRLMTTQEYGHYGVFNSWDMIVSVFITLNLSYGVFTQGMVKHSDDKKNFACAFQGLTLALFFFWCLFYLAFHSVLNSVTGLNTREFVVMLGSAWTAAAYSLWAAEQRIDYNYRRLVFTTLASAICGPSLGIVFVKNVSDKVFGRVFAVFIVNIIVYIIPILFQMLNGGKLFHKGYWKYALLFNIPLIPHYLSQTILSNSDRIMIEKISGESEAGMYNLAYSIAVIAVFFNSALLQTIHPWLYQRIKERQVDQIKTAVYPAFFVIGIINLCLIIFAPEIIYIFAPKSYHEAVWIIPPVAMSSLFNFSYGLFADFEFYYDKPYLATFASVGGAGLNVILNYFFIRHCGYIAAGYTTLMCYILFAVFHYLFMIRICNTFMNRVRPYHTSVLLGGSICFLFLGFAFTAAYNYPMVRYGLVCSGFFLLFFFRKKIVRYVRVFINVRNGVKL